MRLEKVELITVFLFIPCVCFAKKVRVKYSKSGLDIDLLCALKGVQEMSIGVAYTTTQCDVIPYEWPSTLPGGTTTLTKDFTEVIYKTETEWTTHFVPVVPNTRNVEHYAWNLPGNFGTGAELEIHFQIPAASLWSKYQFKLYDANISYGTFHVYDDVDQMMFINVIAFRTENYANVNAWNGFNFINQPQINPNPFTGGNIHILKFVAGVTDVEMSIDGGVHSRTLPYVGPPETARTLAIEAADVQSLPRLEKLIYRPT